MHRRLWGTLTMVVACAGLALVWLLPRARGEASTRTSLHAARTQGQDTAGQGNQGGTAQQGGLIFNPDTMRGWGRGPRQPILFSHRRHAGVYKIDCLYCHTNTDRSPVAYIPAVATCLGCHRVVKAGSPEIQKLRGYEQRGEPIPWLRIHKLADYVQFTHARHLEAGLQCQDCHGPVDSMDVVYQYAPLTMGWCLSCHRQPASADKLAQAEANAREFAKPGLESKGLYPATIDERYGVTRGPIDCVACHY